MNENLINRKKGKDEKNGKRQKKNHEEKVEKRQNDNINRVGGIRRGSIGEKKRRIIFVVGGEEKDAKREENWKRLGGRKDKDK